MRKVMIEIRDHATCIPAMAFRFEPEKDPVEKAFMKQGGWSTDEWRDTYLVDLGGKIEAQYDPYKWDQFTRTMRHAHSYIAREFDKLKDGDVVDVAWYLGERDEPVEPEIYRK